MSKPLTSGIHRERCDVHGPSGWARVERVQDSDPTRERFTVRFYSKGDPTKAGEVVATCWRYVSAAPVAPLHYDGGWVRALAIAEDYTQGSAEEGYHA